MYRLLKVLSKTTEQFISEHENFLDAVAEAESMIEIECFRICDDNDKCIVGVRIAYDDPTSIFWRLSRMEGASKSHMQLRGRDSDVFRQLDRVLA